MHDRVLVCPKHRDIRQAVQYAKFGILFYVVTATELGLKRAVVKKQKPALRQAFYILIVIIKQSPHALLQPGNARHQ